MENKEKVGAGYDIVSMSHKDFWLDPNNFYNALTDLPAILELLGVVKGKKILDLGCGLGKYSKILTDQGAITTGIDISHESIKIAKSEYPGLDFQVGDIENLPYEDAGFDAVISPLVLHHLEDWNKVFSEVNRVLKPGGVFIFSSTNPVMECREILDTGGKKWQALAMTKEGEVVGDYYSEKWKDYNMLGQPIPNHHKTYQTIIRTIVKNGFTIEDYIDEKPLPEAEKVNPIDYQRFTKLPVMFAFKLKKN